jgi:hypothetical protein
VGGVRHGRDFNGIQTGHTQPERHPIGGQQGLHALDGEYRARLYGGAGSQGPGVRRAGKYDTVAGMAGHFHFAEKKGYSGVGMYSRHEPSDVIVGLGEPEFDAEGRYVELRFDKPGRQLSLISCYFPAAPRARSASRPSSASWTWSTRICTPSRARASSSWSAT